MGDILAAARGLSQKVAGFLWLYEVPGEVLEQQHCSTDNYSYFTSSNDTKRRTSERKNTYFEFKTHQNYSLMPKQL